MKKQVLILAALLPCLAKAQSNTFTLTGKIGQLSAPARVYIDYMDFKDNTGYPEDSADVVNGTFTFKGTMNGLGTARMALAHHGEGKQYAVYAGDVIYFFFGKENVVITSKDSLSNAVFTGSKVYNEYLAFNKEIGGTIMQLTKNANYNYNAATAEQKNDSLYMDGLNKQYRQIIDQRAQKQLLYAKNHPASNFALVGLSEALTFEKRPEALGPVFAGLSPELRASKKGKDVDMRIKSITLTTKGATAPLFKMNDVDGKPVSLESLKGKLVLLEFWASWCSPCRAENPNLKKQYELYKSKGFEILAVSLDSDKAKWKQAIAQDGVPWIHVSDLKGWGNAAGALYGVTAVPAGFLIDQDGKIVGNDLRGEKLNAKLAELLGQK
jgi:peroxiredoxin